MIDNIFKPSKALGQNFLTDKNIAEKIVRLSEVDKTCGVLEIGPGLGAMTARLAETAGHVTAVELDRCLIDELKSKIEAYPNVTIISGDILKQDIRSLIAQTLPEPNHHVCANLPYNITTPTITRCIEADVFTAVTVMVQREVARRICAKPGSSEYGAFTVYINYHGKPEILFDVPPECFKPIPKVVSSVVKINICKERMLSSDDENIFFRIVRAAFGQRRKTLINALYSELASTHSKEAIAEEVRNCGFDLKIRGEMLGIEEFVRLAHSLSEL